MTNEPGSTEEQLPDEILKILAVRSYLSTACEAAGFLDDATFLFPEMEEILCTWRQRMHERCRLNNKFTGKLCICSCHPSPTTSQ